MLKHFFFIKPKNVLHQNVYEKIYSAVVNIHQLKIGRIFRNSVDVLDLIVTLTSDNFILFFFGYL